MKARVDVGALERASFALRMEIAKGREHRNTVGAMRAWWRKELHADIAALREIRAALRRAEK